MPTEKVMSEGSLKGYRQLHGCERDELVTHEGKRAIPKIFMLKCSVYSGGPGTML